MKLSIAFVAATLLAAPAFAESHAMDPMKMTCAELMAMDTDGMMAAGTGLKGAMMDDTKMAAMTDEEVTKAAEEACKMHPEAGVMDAMKM